MRKLYLLTTMLASGIVFLASCGAPASNNAANKPANNANAANTAAPVNTGAIEADIKKLISDYAASTGKGDADAYEKMTTDNFMFVSTDGLVQTKAERVASMRSGATKYEKLTYEDVNVRVNPEGDGAVAISKAIVKGMNNGKPIDDTVRVTHVWAKTKDGWKLASLQATSITAKTGPDDKKPDSAASNTANANNSVTGKNPDSATDKK